MIIEAKPLHKKKKRLKKLSTKTDNDEEMDPVQVCLEEIKRDFKLYNRKKLTLQRNLAATGSSSSLREKKEDANPEMMLSDVT